MPNNKTKSRCKLKAQIQWDLDEYLFDDDYDSDDTTSNDDEFCRIWFCKNGNYFGCGDENNHDDASLSSYEDHREASNNSIVSSCITSPSLDMYLSNAVSSEKTRNPRHRSQRSAEASSVADAKKKQQPRPDTNINNLAARTEKLIASRNSAEKASPQENVGHQGSWKTQEGDHMSSRLVSAFDGAASYLLTSSSKQTAVLLLVKSATSYVSVVPLVVAARVHSGTNRELAKAMTRAVNERLMTATPSATKTLVGSLPIEFAETNPPVDSPVTSSCEQTPLDKNFVAEIERRREDWLKIMKNCCKEAAKPVTSGKILKQALANLNIPTGKSYKIFEVFQLWWREDQELPRQQQRNPCQNKAMGRCSLQTSQMVCMVCGGKILADEKCLSRFARCGHSACLSCQRDNVRAKLSSGERSIGCPAFQCTSRLSLPDIAQILVFDDPDDEMFDYLERLLVWSAASFVAAHDEFHFCPSPGCDRVLGPQHNSAPATRQRSRFGWNFYYCDCGGSICLDCKTVNKFSGPAHPGCPCSMDVALAIADPKSLAWILEHTKPCPGCKIPIQRAEGCNHMRCGLCRLSSCWACGRHGRPTYMCRWGADFREPEPQHRGGFTRAALGRILGVSSRTDRLQSTMTSLGYCAGGNGYSKCLEIDSQLHRVMLWLSLASAAAQTASQPFDKKSMEQLEHLSSSLTIRKSAIVRRKHGHSASMPRSAKDKKKPRKQTNNLLDHEIQDHLEQWANDIGIAYCFMNDTKFEALIEQSLRKVLRQLSRRT